MLRLILLAFLILLLIYRIIFRSYFHQAYRFNLYVGKPRSGKTTMMTKYASKFRKKGITVYSNIELKVDGVRLFNANDISLERFFEPESVILIDEPNLYWDNRSYKDINKSVIEWFRLYGHNRVNIYMWSQTYDIDKKLRKLVSNIYIIKKFFGTITICRMLNKNIQVAESAMDAESQIVDRINYMFFLMPGATEFIFIPKWTKYFDSFYLPAGEPIKYQTIRLK